jgi:hypothetical protein
VDQAKTADEKKAASVLEKLRRVCAAAATAAESGQTVSRECMSVLSEATRVQARRLRQDYDSLVATVANHAEALSDMRDSKWEKMVCFTATDKCSKQRHVRHDEQIRENRIAEIKAAIEMTQAR